MVSIRDGVLKMTKGSMVVMKGVRQNNLYYLKGSTVTGQVEISISSDDVCIQVWQMRVEHGGKYKSDPFLKLCRDEGIDRHFTVRETPQQNEVAERLNRTLLEKVRSMLSNARLPKNF